MLLSMVPVALFLVNKMLVLVNAASEYLACFKEENHTTFAEIESGNIQMIKVRVHEIITIADVKELVATSKI